jgi:uncharacterized protein
LEALIRYIASALVDRPEDVQVRTSESDGGELYELKVAQDDVGKVIGRDGRTVNALRTLVSAAAQKQGKRAKVEILDERRGGADPAQPPEAEPAPPQ